MLLAETISINQYKVYASLSRIGYKVFRHKKRDLKESINIQKEDEGLLEDIEEINCVSNLSNCSEKEKTESNSLCMETNNLKDNFVISNNTGDHNSIKQAKDDFPKESYAFHIQEKSKLQKNKNDETDIESENPDVNVNLDNCRDVNITKVTNNVENISSSKERDRDINFEDNLSPFMLKLQTLEKRQLKPCSTEILHKAFDGIPDLFMKTTVTLSGPEDQYIPRNVFVNNTKYVLNLNLIISKPPRSSHNETTYSNVDEVNEPHIRRLRSTSHVEYFANYNNVNQNTTFPRQQNFTQFRPFNFWRPQQNNYPFNIFTPRMFPNYLFGTPPFSVSNTPLNMFLPRMFPNNFFASPQFRFDQNPFPPRPTFNPFHSPFMPRRLNVPTAHNSMNDEKLMYLQTIKCLALKIRNLSPPARINLNNLLGLRRLVELYNTLYNCRLRLTETYDVVDDTNIVETIELDDDSEPKTKKPRKNFKYEENLGGIKDLVSKIKMSEKNNGYKPKYRRILSNIIKKFNRSYNADIYLNKECEVIDRKQIVLDSSSDSDCIATESVNPLKRKKLRNPFSIMKRHTGLVKGTPNENIPKNDSEQSTSKALTPGEKINNFNKSWLPNENDFGKPEVVPKSLMTSRLQNTIRDKYLYEFLSDSTVYNDWFEIKIAYLKYLEESNKVFQDQQKLLNEYNFMSTHSGLQPLLRPEDCSNMGKVLARLRIISVNNNTTVTPGESNYQIDFDVYNRDVKQFRKSNPPKPHFRIVCVE